MKLLAVVAVAIATLAGVSSAISDEAKPEVKIFAGYVTRTRFNVLTSTTLLSCVSALGQSAVCQGRRKRSPANLAEELTIMEPSEQLSLDGSVGEHSVDKRQAPASAEAEKGKLFVSLTTFTTMTTTSFTANTATTVSVSFHCIPPDGVNLPFCTG